MFNDKTNDFYDDSIDQMLRSALQVTPEQVEKENEYSDLLLQYAKIHDAMTQEEYDELIPSQFKISKMIDTKIEVLKECIEKKILIVDSISFIKMQEGSGMIMK